MPHKTLEARREYNALWRIRNRAAIKASGTKYRRKRRLSVIEKLGGKCVACGITDIRVLQIDHINGGGGAERTTRDGWGFNIETAILKGERSDLQLLCANCHSIKTWHEK